MPEPRSRAGGMPGPPMGEDNLSLYDFDLPPDRIAQRPAARRDAARLMVLRGDAPPEHRRFHELPALLRPGDLLVRNDTKVIPARLRGHRPGGGRVELLLVHRHAGDGAERWQCLARPASHLRAGQRLVFGEAALVAEVVARGDAGRVEVVFDVPDAGAFRERLEACGETPLPPYIHRPDGGPDAEDRTRYQTLYAAAEGAVAAPTAGLHFTPAVEAALAARGIEVAALTLHVGPGTFRPIQAETLAGHVMEAEFYRVSVAAAAAVNAARAAGRRVLAVGTTVTRTLESSADARGQIACGEGWTDLFIRPGYAFRAIAGLLTNFHLPRSSLFVLVAALAGRERMHAAYGEAIREGYRFYSYGDAMLILPGEGV